MTNDESVENETDHYIRRERRMASAQRQFYVGDVDENKIEAKYDRGVLEVTVPKLTQQMESRRIIDIQ